MSLRSCPGQALRDSGALHGPGLELGDPGAIANSVLLIAAQQRGHTILHDAIDAGEYAVDAG